MVKHPYWYVAALLWGTLAMTFFAPGTSKQVPSESAPPDEETQPAESGGFDGSNGFTDAKQFASDLADFSDTEGPEQGLGPVFNAESCLACHNNPVVGGSNVFAELRAGHFDGQKFVEHPGGSLIQARALDPSIQERVFAGNELRGFRSSLNLLGDGFIECVSQEDIKAFAASQSPAQRGEVTVVPLLEAPGQSRVGRFGWKAQHASLLSFAADASLNEIGRTSKFLPVKNTSNGRDVTRFDRSKQSPNDPDNQEQEALARFMRATKAPPRDFFLAASKEGQQGLALFRSLGCVVCHREEWTTIAAGGTVNAGTFKVPDALGGKTFAPFSDFLLHDIGTGDGITFTNLQSAANKFRTPPLWGLRTRSRLRHDGTWFTRHEAILGHKVEGLDASLRYQRLPVGQQQLLLLFLRSL